MNGLDLFSGIGGIGLGLKDYVRTIAYCEQDRFAQAVLLSRMQSGDIDVAPIFTDVRKLSGSNFITKPDIIFGGFPCQDISFAGIGGGLEGKRSGLFFEIIRLAKEISPSFVFLENVPAIRTRGLREVVTALAKIGYDSRWTCLSAASIGALHKRERWFLLANAKSNGSERNSRELFKAEKASERKKPWTFVNGGGEDAVSARSQRTPWDPEPSVGRMAYGVQFGVDRIKCLGNSVVPEQVKAAFEKLINLN